MDRRVTFLTLLLATVLPVRPACAQDGHAPEDQWWRSHVMSPKAMEIERALGIAGPDEVDELPVEFVEPNWVVGTSGSRRSAKPGTDVVPRGDFLPLERALRPGGNEAMNETRLSLAIIRDAIELYRSQKGHYPTSAAELGKEIRPFLRQPIPAVLLWFPCSDVVENDDSPLSPTGVWNGWVYNPKTGDISINHPKYISW